MQIDLRHERVMFLRIDYIKLLIYFCLLFYSYFYFVFVHTYFINI